MRIINLTHVPSLRVADRSDSIARSLSWSLPPDLDPRRHLRAQKGMSEDDVCVTMTRQDDAACEDDV